eukprot:GHVH01004950.1.p1 GENE.GHVH01004950.1~~GHVH01004950.1.p1  ORF type:complete len:243 (+),score=19.84 GHVH01004950.1:391-1119(+)
MGNTPPDALEQCLQLKPIPEGRSGDSTVSRSDWRSWAEDVWEASYQPEECISHEYPDVAGNQFLYDGQNTEEISFIEQRRNHLKLMELAVCKLGSDYMKECSLLRCFRCLSSIEFPLAGFDCFQVLETMLGRATVFYTLNHLSQHVERIMGSNVVTKMHWVQCSAALQMAAFVYTCSELFPISDPDSECARDLFEKEICKTFIEHVSKLPNASDRFSKEEMAPPYTYERVLGSPQFSKVFLK